MATNRKILLKGIQYLAGALPTLFIGPVIINSAFKNKENQIKEVFTIITPLGVNLGINPAIRFDNDKQ